jgi:hypothetical protein
MRLELIATGPARVGRVVVIRDLRGLALCYNPRIRADARNRWFDGLLWVGLVHQ